MRKITGPLFKWFGSKWLSSRTLPEPKFDIIVEPFAGGAGYSLRYCDKDIVICENNVHIYNLWNWLIHAATESDIRSIPINLPEGTDIRTIGLSEGQQLLLKNWQRTNNVGNCWTVSAWGNKPGQWTENTRSRVSSEFHYIKHWRVSNDAAKAFSVPFVATWFIDPPYMYNYQYGGAAIDYNKLAIKTQSVTGQVIVCEAICPKTLKVPDWLNFVYFGDRITSRRKASNNHHSKELIYTKEQ